MASDDSDLAGAPLGAALCPEARGPLLFSASLGADCNFLFGSNGAGTASRYSCWGGPLADTHSARGAAPFLFGDNG